MIELGQTPTGPPFEHRIALFNSVIAAMRDAGEQLAQDGLKQDLIVQIVANTIMHAAAHLAVMLDLDRPDMCETFLGYCDKVQEAQSNIPRFDGDFACL
jgi:hypothetical protein